MGFARNVCLSPTKFSLILLLCHTLVPFPVSTDLCFPVSELLCLLLMLQYICLQMLKVQTWSIKPSSVLSIALTSPTLHLPCTKSLQLQNFSKACYCYWVLKNALSELPLPATAVFPCIMLSKWVWKAHSPGFKHWLCHLQFASLWEIKLITLSSTFLT